MPISFVSGLMLNANLTRNGQNLSFSNTTSSGSILFIDVGNNRVGVNTSSTVSALTVNGDTSISGNITGANLFFIANTIGTNNGNLVTFARSAGIVIPSGSSSDRPSPAPIGTIRLNTGLDQLEVYDGTQWLAGGGGGTGNVTIIDVQLTGDNSTTTFDLGYPADTSSILVSLNGVAQLPTLAYTASGNSITFSQAPAVGDSIDVRFLAAAMPNYVIHNNTGNAAVTVNTSNIVFTVNQSNVATITTGGIINFSASQSVQLPSYSVVQTANIASPAAGQIIYVTNGDSGNPCLAVYSGGNWLRVRLGNLISSS